MVLDRMVISTTSAIGFPSGLKTVWEQPRETSLMVKRVMPACSDRWLRDWVR